MHMNNEIISWLIVSLAILGVLTAILAYLRTPSEQRHRFPGVPVEEKLKDCPENSQAVIIKGNKRRALVNASPYIFIGLVLVGFSLWVETQGDSVCARFLGLNAAYISLLLFFYGLPIGCLIVSLSFAGTGIKTIRTGYFPPLDSVLYGDTIAKKGTISTIRGYTLLALPIFTLFVVYLGHNVYTTVTERKSMQEVIEMLEAKCRLEK